MSRYQYPRPGNDDEFEEFCLRFYRIFLERDAFDRYGKRGERQHGIDLFDQLAKKPASCVQCKHREAHKTLRPAEIEAEVFLGRQSIGVLGFDHDLSLCLQIWLHKQQ